MSDSESKTPVPGNWIWIESLQIPVIILDVSTARVAAMNIAACSALGVDRDSLVGASSTEIVPDYLLPDSNSIEGWIQEARKGEFAGTEIDLLIEARSTVPFRANARLGLADSDGNYLSVIFEPVTTNSDDRVSVLPNLMSDIGRIVGMSLDLEAVSQRFAISLMQVVPAHGIAVLLIDEDETSLSVAYSTDSSLPTGNVSLTPDDPVVRVIETGYSLLLDSQEIIDVGSRESRTWPASASEIRSACCVPLMASGTCIGVVLLSSRMEQAFGADDLELLEHAASQVAGAISNVMLHEKISRDSTERDVLASIGRLASSAIDFEAAMPGIAEQTKRFMPVSQLCVYEPDDAMGQLKATYSWSQPGAEPALDPQSSSEAAIERQTALRGAGYVVSTVHLSGDGRMASQVTAPLRFGGETIGVLTALSSEGRSFTPREAAFALLLSGQIAGAVHTARAYRSQQREADLRKSLAQISVTASRDLSPDSVFERIASEVAELFLYDLFAIALRNPDQTELKVRFQIGMEGVPGIYSEMADEKGGLVLEWRENLVEEASESDLFKEFARTGINSLIEASLGSPETGATGYLLIGSMRTKAFKAIDLRILSRVAAQVTPAVQNAAVHEQAVALAEARMSEAKAEARNLELEKINDAKSRFLSIVSHELRTPLTSIVAYSELLERNSEQTLSEKQLNQCAIINKSAMHLKFLIGDLLDVSRVESGNLSLDMSTFDIGSAVRDVIDQFQPVLKSKDQEFVVFIGPEEIQLRADRPRIVQVVSNLVENASKYSPTGTRITVSLHRRGHEVVIAVSDQGIGISDEDRSQLFVPFFRANSELTRTEPGTGLGLALVKSIVELHGGSVSVESEPGNGSTFSIALRAAAARSAA